MAGLGAGTPFAFFLGGAGGGVLPVTTSSNSTLNYQRDQLLTTAFRLAGVLDADGTLNQADARMGADFMNLELQYLQADGVVLRTIERTTLTLVAGTTAYVLPADTIDVDTGPNGIAGTIVPALGSESAVVAMTRAEYMQQTDKGSVPTGRPLRVYIERGAAAVTLIFWPPPDTSAATFRYGRVRLLRDMDTGAVTVDLARRWLQFVTYAVATQVAMSKSIPLDRVSWLRKRAEEMKERLMADDTERGTIRISISHNRRWP
jgi:hypothetical protein